jgi:hypothetical protein
MGTVRLTTEIVDLELPNEEHADTWRLHLDRNRHRYDTKGNRNYNGGWECRGCGHYYDRLDLHERACPYVKAGVRREDAEQPNSRIDMLAILDFLIIE